MNFILLGALDELLVVYLDDIYILSHSEEEHMQYLRWLLARPCQYSLFSKRKKCFLIPLQVEYLGHIVSGTSVQADPSKISLIVWWAVLKNAPDIRVFLNLANNHLSMLRDYTSIAALLHEFLRMYHPFEWGCA